MCGRKVRSEDVKQIIEMGKGIGAGFYFMTPFNRVSLVKSILEYV